MMNLLLTRAKYFRKNYIFIILSIIPIFIIIILSIDVQSKKSDIDTLDKSSPQIISPSYSLIDYSSQFKNISQYLTPNYGAIIANEDECNNVNNFYKTKYPCISEEAFREDEDYHYAFSISRVKGKYQIKLFSKEYFVKKRIFKSVSLQEFPNIEIFKYKNRQYNNESEIEDLNLYLGCLTFFTNYLIARETGTETIKNDLNIIFGLNSFPKIRYVEKLYLYRSYFFIIFFYFIFAVCQYYFFIVIKNEVQKDLSDYLYNNDVTKLKYFFSLFLFYIALFFIPSFILFILSFLFSYHSFLFLLNLIFYILASFTFCCFVLLIINKKRYYFAIYIGMVIIVIFSIKCNFYKSFKICLTFIPDVNFMFSLNTFFKLNSFKEINAEEFIMDINRISYSDCFFGHILNIFYYTFISFLILYNRQSELDISSFFKELFSSKKKEEQKINNNNLLINNENRPNINEINNENNQKDCLKINNLLKSYNSVKIIENLNLELYSDEIYCLFSKNKICRNYLIKIIAGLIKPSYGDIILNGEEKFNNQNVGIYLHKEIFFDYLTVKEYIQFLFKLKKINNENDINTILETIQLNEFKDTLCKRLNELQKRLLSLSYVLIGNPKILLFEEPLKNLSDENIIKIIDFIKELKKNKIIFITTDSIFDAQKLGDKIGIMSNNHIIFSDSINKFNSLCLNDSNIIDLNIYINSNIFKEEKFNILIEKIKEFEPNFNVAFKNNQILIIKINSNNNEINNLIDCIEKSKEELGIEDYTLTNSNSFEIFLEKINLTEIKISNENDIIINDNNNISRPKSILSRLFKQFKYNFVLFRKKYTYIFSLITLCDFFLFFCIFYHHLSFIPNTFESIKLLKGNPIYFYSDIKHFLTKSDFYKHFLRYIELIKIKDMPRDITNFIEKLYDKSYAHIAKSGISIKKNDNENKYEVYLTEIYNKDFGYLFANLVFVFSAYLKYEYNIDASILTSFTSIPEDIFSDTEEYDYDYEYNLYVFMKNIVFVSFFPICFLIRNFYIFYEIVNERIKNRNALNEFLFYLYGEKLKNNWIVSLIVDYIKIFFFSFLYFYPIYLFIDFGSYFLFNIPFISLSILLFLYLISNVFSKVGEKKKKFYVLVSIIILPVLLTFILLIADDLDSSVSFSFLSLFPIFSYPFTYLFFFYKFYFKERIINEWKYIYYNFLIQIINILLYSLLLYLYKKGYLKKLNVFKCFRKDKYEYPKEIISDEFINRNELNDFNLESANIILMNNNIPELNNNVNDINNDINKIDKNSPILENNNLSENLVLENHENLENINLILKIKDLKKTYYGKTNFKVINDLNLDIEKNEKLCILGPDNSGKSTLIKLIMKEIDYEYGQILLFENQNIKIGYCPQTDYLVDYKTVREIIDYYIYLKSVPDTLDSVCQDYELYDCLDTYYIHLSIGNKKKLHLAIALMGKPDLLILDEPSSDKDSMRILKKKINELIKNRHNFSMILCSKSIEEGEMLCERVSWLKEGNLYLCDSPKNIKIDNNSIFKLIVKFDIFKVKKEELDEKEMNQQLFYDALALIEKVNKYNEYVYNVLKIKLYLKSLINFVNNIKEYTYKIKLINIGNNLVFTLVVGIKKEKQKEFYSTIFNIKNNNEEISDVLIW